ncbi:MAG TPA: hypothetical protein VD993_07245 [Chitinophagaceae bacterium]|nr:hypothetical protein [Chitinophagaceae bacterium]
MHYSSADHQTYNQLPDVLVADKKLTSLGRTKVLDSLSKTILKYNLENVVGIRLLHNHNTIAPDEIMLEQEEINEAGEYCLSTIATNKNDAHTQGCANSWMLGARTLTPLEFSVDPAVTTDSGSAIANQQFLREFYQDLVTLDAADILGPCVINRSFYKERMPAVADDILLVETTDAVRKANVLRFRNSAEYKPEQLIETTWMATDPKENEEEKENGPDRKLVFYCRVGQCTPTCAVIIHCEDQDGQHLSTSRHEKQLHWKEHIKTVVPPDQLPPAEA